jgi:HEPN domain-containing protein
MTARRSLETGNLAPARFLSVHALELALKAVLAARLADVPRTHNIGGEFGRHFRERVGSDACRRINRILGDYDGPRYPDWEVPSMGEIEADIGFIEDFLHMTVPKLVQEAGA